jgi:lytic murein transglycosylase
MQQWPLCALLICLAWVLPVFPALTAACGDPSGFHAWLDSFKGEAAAQGISQSVIDSALAGITYDPNIISRDRKQGVFKQSFEQFSSRMVSADRLRKGSSMLKRYGSILDRIEQKFGVPGSVIIAIWGFETDFGTNLGKFPIFRSLATLAYDCRRSALFQAELLGALRIVERGDLAPAEMRGAWAGEIGQTQFMPSSYVKYAVDYNGNGKHDLIKSVPDALASTANYLKSHGWRRGEPWAEGSPNFDVLQKWNESQVYSRTLAYFAVRLETEP